MLKSGTFSAFVVFLLVSAVSAAAPAAAAAGAGQAKLQSAVSGSEQEQFDFAKHLLDIKEYYRAIGEFERFVFFFPSSRLCPEARFLGGLAYYRAGQYDDAVRAFDVLSSDDNFGFTASALSADGLFRQDRFDACSNAYSGLRIRFPEKDEDLLFSLSWPVLMKKDYRAALALYDEFLERYPQDSRAGDVVYLQSAVKKLEKSRGMSPPVAAALSAVLPGAGQVYTRRPGDGMIAFGCVAILASGSYLLWRYYDHKEVAVVATVAVGFFYCGNIYSAWSSAKKYNLLYGRRTLDNLRNTYWSDHDH